MLNQIKKKYNLLAQINSLLFQKPVLMQTCI